MDTPQQPAKKELRIISSDSVNAVLKYLAIRPYHEVMNVVPLLLNLEIVKEETTKEPEQQ